MLSSAILLPWNGASHLPRGLFFVFTQPRLPPSHISSPILLHPKHVVIKPCNTICTSSYYFPCSCDSIKGGIVIHHLLLQRLTEGSPNVDRLIQINEHNGQCLSFFACLSPHGEHLCPSLRGCVHYLHYWHRNNSAGDSGLISLDIRPSHWCLSSVPRSSNLLSISSQLHSMCRLLTCHIFLNSDSCTMCSQVNSIEREEVGV
jgi:hypothetical protein